ncbi:hypothetical protein ABH920_001293 [Catenulispora sp. EB89]
MYVADRVAVASPASSLAALKQRAALWKPWWKPIAAVLVLAAMVLLSLKRTQGFGSTDTIWAEDGRQFYAGTLQHNYIDLLFTPYNGYLHFVPRTLIEIVRFFPLSWAAAVIATMGALVASACALLVYRASSRHLPSTALRVAVAAPVALPYVGQLELANNFACLHFLLLYVSFWMVIWNPEHKRNQILAAFVLFATIGSDPVDGVFLPLALLRWWTVRGRRGALPVIGMGTGMLFQGIGIVFRHALDNRPMKPHYDPVWAVEQFFQTVAGQGLYTGDVNQRLGLPVNALDTQYVAWAIAGVALLLALLRITAPNWPLVLTALVHSLLLFCGLAMQGGSAAPRYELPAICLFLVAVAGLVVPRRDAAIAPPRIAMAIVIARAVPAFAILGLVALCIYGGYGRSSHWRASGPSFSAQLSKASQTCSSADAHSAVITVAPLFRPWAMTVPCDLVRHRDAFFQLSP